MHHEAGGLRLHRGRRRLRGLRRRKPALRRSVRARSAARGRRRRRRLASAHAWRSQSRRLQPAVQLVLRDRAPGTPRRPAHRLAPRPRAGRLVDDKRDGLCARPPRRLRPLGGRDRRRPLGLCPPAPLLQARPGPRAGRRCLPWRCGSFTSLPRRLRQSAQRRLYRGRDRRRFRRHRRFQWCLPGGLRMGRHDRPQGRALERVTRLSRPRPPSPESGPANPRAGATRPV